MEILHNSFQNVRITYKKLMNHLKLKQKILVKPCNKAEASDKPRFSQIDSFCKKKQQSISEIIAELVAKDGFSFNQPAKSELTITAFTPVGFDIQESLQGARK